MRATPGEETAIFSAMDGFLDDIKNKRLEETLARFTGDPDCALIGSEKGEVALGPDGLRKFFAGMYQRPSVFSVTWGDRQASQHGDVAWFSAEVDAHMSSSARTAPYRITCVFMKRSGRWLVHLYHGSEQK